MTGCYTDILEKAQTVNTNAAKTETACQKAEAAAETASAYAVLLKNRPETIYTAQKDLGSTSGACTVSIEPGIFEYKATPAGNTDFTFDFSGCNTDMIVSFSLLLDQTANSYTYSYTFSEMSSFQWLDNLAASPSGSYLMTFRRYPDGRILGVANGVIAS